MRLRIFIALFLTAAIGLLTAFNGDPAQPKLKYIVVISRHGVRSPIWTAERLNQYSTKPWPDFGVPPGDLTPHGRDLMKLMGSYYREWFIHDHLLKATGCDDAGRIYIHAAPGQRMVESGRALAEILLPGCTITVHSQPEGAKDALFDPIQAGTIHLDWAAATKAVRDRLTKVPEQVLSIHGASFSALESVLTGDQGTPQKPIAFPGNMNVSGTEDSVQLSEPWADAATLSEDLQLEYVNGMRGPDLGWGRLNAGSLARISELRAAYVDIMRRTPYLALARGSNLMQHVLLSIDQAMAGKPVAGAIGQPGDAALMLVGGDTSLSSVAALLGLNWHLMGYQPNDTPPGGALVLSLWKQANAKQYYVRTQYLAQTLDQMKNASAVSLADPPALQDLQVPGCEAADAATGCFWEDFEKAAQKAIDPKFVVADPAGK